MKLERCKKKYVDGTHRVCSPQETYDAVSSKMPAVSIDSVEDITSMDRLAIPVFLACGHDDRSGATFTFKGKGASPIEAQVSAMMEALERYCSAFDESRVLVAPESALDSPYVVPHSLVLPNPMMYHDGMSIAWTRSYDLLGQQDTYVPSNAVFHPFPQNYGWLFRSNTNGLAAGNCIEEAILHALCEVVERDAWSLAEVVPNYPPQVEYDGKNSTVISLLDHFRDNEVDVSVTDITSDLGIPTFVAAADDKKTRDPTLLTVGVGSHLNPDVALIRALTEVAQSRLTQIYENERNPNGAVLKRRLGYERILKMNARWFTATDTRIFSELSALDTQYVRDDIEIILSILSANGFEQAVVSDLSSESLGMPVVRVTVPGLEQCSVDRDRIGTRARNAVKK